MNYNLFFRGNYRRISSDIYTEKVQVPELAHFTSCIILGSWNGQFNSDVGGCDKIAMSLVGGQPPPTHPPVVTDRELLGQGDYDSAVLVFYGCSPSPKVRQVIVTNEGDFAADIAVTGEFFGIELGPIEAKAKDVVFDLANAVYLVSFSKSYSIVDTDFDKIQVRVWISTYANQEDPTWLVFNKYSDNEAVYIVGGDANDPTISFKGLRGPIGAIET
ncbi:hypothetical protein BDP27DRAFT_1360930 [Rhodocollybia butyracea]|uniref:Uncharacterized protein n=1 Tax=Rhodocollybia butyracea TaxID=206335 RepID=A0A9P5UA28_9AGAR|nr:hypothetical protein BDP27DRAFT_1360930 [Rhodocollybia butyracea]